MAAKTLLLGYAGKGNFGDDVMIDAVRALVTDEVEVIGGDMPWGRMIAALRGAERVVLCGGHVISPRHGAYLRVMSAARALGVRRALFSVEVSGWPKGRAGRLQRYSLGGARVAVRTAQSAEILRAQLPKLDVEQVGDVFYLHPAFATPEGTGAVALDRYRVDTAKTETRDILILPRQFPTNGAYTEAQNHARIDAVLAGLDADLPIRVSPSAAVDDTGDLLRHLQAQGRKVAAIAADEPLVIDGATRCITNRLHVAKALAFWGVDTTLVSYDVKNEAPEIIGHTGNILMLDGSIVPIRDISMTSAAFLAQVHATREALRVTLTS